MSEHRIYNSSHENDKQDQKFAIWGTLTFHSCASQHIMEVIVAPQASCVLMLSEALVACYVINLMSLLHKCSNKQPLFPLLQNSVPIMGPTLS
jgi:hypothetical protein